MLTATPRIQGKTYRLFRPVLNWYGRNVQAGCLSTGQPIHGQNLTHENIFLSPFFCLKIQLRFVFVLTISLVLLSTAFAVCLLIITSAVNPIYKTWKLYKHILLLDGWLLHLKGQSSMFYYTISQLRNEQKSASPDPLAGHAVGDHQLRDRKLI